MQIFSSTSFISNSRSFVCLCPLIRNEKKFFIEAGEEVNPWELNLTQEMISRLTLYPAPNTQTHEIQLDTPDHQLLVEISPLEGVKSCKGGVCVVLLDVYLVKININKVRSEIKLKCKSRMY